MKARGSIPEGVDDMTILRAFHGHLGPYVVAGLRMGRYALGKLQADPHFGVEAEVRCPDLPPPSCAMDGIQFATGCTLGKRNISHQPAEGVRARFRNRDSGAELVVALRPEAMARAVAELKQHDDEAAAALVMAMTEAELLAELPEL
jgi:formylmethanofuran dehydrogenase subunit E